MSLPGKVVDALYQAESSIEWQDSPDENHHCDLPEETKADDVAIKSFCGQVKRVRWYSTKMFFFDVVGEPSAEEPELDRLACVYRQGAQHWTGKLTTSDIVRFAADINLGDLVSVFYYRRPLDTSRGERSVEVHDLRIDRAWKDTNPHGTEFQAEITPPPLPEKTIETATWKARAPKGDVCKFWVNSGSCPLRACTLRHVAEEERAAARRAWQEEREKRRAAALAKQGADVGDTVALHDKKHKKYRAETLCGWLLEKVGKDRLSQGSGVLDIAGGKGEISKILFANGVPCTVIDPRRCPPRNPAHAAVGGPSYVLANFDDDLIRSPEHTDLLRRASFVIGMHPDQATEPLVDFALQHRKPFAVVPCCVFPRQSAQLRTKANDKDSQLARGEGQGERGRAGEGELVVTYEDFVDYLQAKHPQVERTFLQFRGRNAVLHLFDYGQSGRAAEDDSRAE